MITSRDVTPAEDNAKRLVDTRHYPTDYDPSLRTKVPGGEIGPMRAFPRGYVDLPPEPSICDEHGGGPVES